ncbi:RHS repeat domain-containing protein [Leifsonia sp. McL0607]|uniref:RHS repeat domain-containing protein n=1 Tax=Leifsonia sp. McL0607 TaxID=3415672 RepID=UPI003CED459C
MTDPTGVSGWIYDRDGRATTQIDQRGGRLSAEFDGAGQRTSLSLPTGEKLGYTYDKSGRVTSQTWPWGDLGYRWDAAGNLTELSRSTGVATSYSYDAADRVTRILHETPEPVAPAVASATPTPVPFGAADVAKACTTVAGYLSARTAPAAGESDLCKHSNTYLHDRSLPVPANPVEDGGSLAYAYAYDKDGNVTKATRTVFGAEGSGSKPVVRSVGYGYDGLDRLVSSMSSMGEKNTYAYDAVGNRTGWSRSGAQDGDFTQSASFSDANQLLRSETSGAGRGVADGVASYSYDAAGMRASQSIGGVGTSYRYDPSGRTAQVSRDGRSTSYAYDGLGRQAAVTDQTRYGTETTSNTFDGSTVVQRSDDLHGTASLVRDAAGNLAAHVASSGEATWDLLDRLGSTVAGATGASIAQLASYDDWGTAVFESEAWSAPEGFTGELTDPTSGLNAYAARSYDPAAATWTAADPWKGLLSSPKSMSRYMYVHSNPATFIDVGGNRIGDPSAYNTSDPLHAYEMRQVDNATNQWVADNRAKTFGYDAPPQPKAVAPNWESDLAWRHALYESYWPEGVSCDSEVKVGYTEKQLAINTVCARALELASMSSQPKWIRDLYLGIQSVADSVRPLAAIGVVFVGGAAGLPRRGLASGEAVSLGHYPAYTTLGDTVGAKLFTVPLDKWNAMTRAEQWAMNRQFLDGVIAGGDEILLATPYAEARAGSFFEMELTYLESKGYNVSVDGRRMVLK